MTLVTGERVGLSAGVGGRPTAHVLRTGRPGFAGVVSIAELGGDTYVLPAIAKPYLGRFLDPALFDVSALTRVSATARLGVRISYQGSAVPSVPGITVTHAGAGTATGYLTAASTASFGTALQRQFAADTTAGWPARSTLFGTVTRISSAAATVPVVTPKFPMQTLIIKVLGADGAPVPDAFMGVMNVDNAAKFESFVAVVDGEARISVPVGRYAGIAAIDTFDPQTFTGSSRLLPFDGFTVSTNDQTLRLDARAATSKLGVITPRRAGRVMLSWEWDRFAAGQSGGIQFGTGGGTGFDLYTAPIAAPPATTGTLNSLTTWALAGAGATGSPYTYDLAFAASGVPAVQQHTVASADLQTVDATYSSDHGVGQGAFLRSPRLPFQFFAGGFLNPISTPIARTEYVQDTPSAVWTSFLLADVSGQDPFAAAWLDGDRLAPAGTTARADWLTGPLVSSIPAVTDGTAAEGGAFCSACRTPHRMELFIAPVTDSTPGHFGFVTGSPNGKPVARFRVFADGVSIFDQPDSAGGVFPVSTTAAEYKVVDDVDRRFGGAVQSTTTHTVLTFNSAAGQGGTLPTGWHCELSAACTIPPILQAAVGLPVDLTGQVRIGNSTIAVGLSHIQGAPQSGIASATCQIRVGTGAWRSLAVTGVSGGRFTFALHTTSGQAGLPVDLRVTGSDVDGATISQTTTRAFVVAGS